MPSLCIVLTYNSNVCSILISENKKNKSSVKNETEKNNSKDGCKPVSYTHLRCV